MIKEAKREEVSFTRNGREMIGTVNGIGFTDKPVKIKDQIIIEQGDPIGILIKLPNGQEIFELADHLSPLTEEVRDRVIANEANSASDITDARNSLWSGSGPSVYTRV